MKKSRNSCLRDAETFKVLIADCVNFRYESSNLFVRLMPFLSAASCFEPFVVNNVP